MAKSIAIFREMKVKQIVTEKSKAITKEQLAHELNENEQEILNLEVKNKKILTEFSLKGLEADKLDQIRHHYNLEMRKQRIRHDEIQSEMMELDKMEVGEEVIIASLQGPYELKVGDKMNSVANVEVVLKDGFVVEIRD